jgi:hypothetical protein
MVGEARVYCAANSGGHTNSAGFGDAPRAFIQWYYSARIDRRYAHGRIDGSPGSIAAYKQAMPKALQRLGIRG